MYDIYVERRARGGAVDEETRKQRVGRDVVMIYLVKNKDSVRS